jgi:LysM repeat protein
MKRRTRLRFISCAAPAALFLLLTPAGAGATGSIGSLDQSMVVASDSPTNVVHAPIGEVTVEPGDTLTAIGARTSRTWEQLAGYNQLPNPNLILPGQVLTIPPAGYVPPSPVVDNPVVTTTVKTEAVIASAPAQAPVSAPSEGTTDGTGIWACIAQHESGGNPAEDTGNGYYGAFQFDPSSWAAAGGGPGLPSDYSYSEQLAVAQRLQSMSGWGAWPNTSAMCGA